VVQSISARQLAKPSVRRWTFLTNHAQVLLAVAQHPNIRVRQIAEAAAITERYAYRLLRDLEIAGYVDRRRRGRCNLYRVHPHLALGDPVVEERLLRELLQLVSRPRARGELTVALAPRRRRA
jgi:DNA-binding IclR family transcriptional regulator